MNARILETQQTIEYQIVNKIRPHAYIIHIVDTVDTNNKVGIMYQSIHEDKWLMNCNLGSVSCPPSNTFLTLHIPNTYSSPEREYIKNKALFSPKFFDYLKDKTDVYFYENNDDYINKWIEIIYANLPDIETEDIPYILTKEVSRMSEFAFDHILYQNATFADMRMSTEFLQKQIDYCKNLSPRYKIVLRLYSHNGDVLLNMYLRNKRQVSQTIAQYYLDHHRSFVAYLGILNYKDRFMLNNLLEDFYEDMKQIVYRAPKADKEFLLFRGIKTKDHFHGTVDNVYINRGFVSTSPNIDVAIRFSEMEYMTIIHVPVGASMIFNLYSKYIREFEFILPDATYFLVTKDFQEKQFIVDMAEKIQTNECILLIDTSSIRR